MPLIQTPPPDAAKRAFLDGLGIGPDDSSRMLQFSVPVYGLSLPELRKNTDSLQTKLLGWQFLAIDKKGLAVAGEVPIEPDYPDGEMTTSLVRGAATDEAWKAWSAPDVIREQPDVRREAFELRQLRISSLRIETFWLKSPPSDNLLSANDRVYPFLTFQEQLKSKLLSVPAFLTVVRQLAAKPVVQNAPSIRPAPPPGKP